MPHLIMEYTESVSERVNIDQVVEALHQAAIASEVFEPAALKSRAVPCGVWRVGEQADRGDFIHVEFRLLDGRTVAQKQAISQALVDVLSRHASHVSSLTVEIRDMETKSYSKRVASAVV
ncbi:MULTISPECIES: 5-carboxymethyl-2-hydroxymuconate Delta-isomerase [Salinivibrio]|uniref:5-carboxymethyl-2-hydroxymuconate Delta-isomerase n=1 Tax=Salinivibrio costicola TaxID=51367 RepID=A0ABX6K0G8_SALCS|nr:MULTISPECIES: 5-carboxymethyl-2-hydroxymuconate Delta-isomerase [Salinivibrio]ODP96749.1 5-carboxymethyl-2-hydroxymuconate isomerase [Salinivibrio sp. DV]OOF11695.1 5-carboxymethyl-2-hydroxymuconate isomerase [Salinivibrio sp. PR5]OOF14945.1 5-carboxymethyl-2-hydroxymuconate isomerase [Salinivibrio sp. PR919]OOF17409.1 5-carboxymethyl-2-hydroxymuconate isomerase [Salinivibrio sp. PR932]OOF23484.1 5-carboxymethyl-2-hydroxymuconate isomerase [Salinivibrio sp. IB574]